MGKLHSAEHSHIAMSTQGCLEGAKDSAAAVQGKGHFISQQQEPEAYKAADSVIAPQVTERHCWPLPPESAQRMLQDLWEKCFSMFSRDSLKNGVSLSVLADEKAAHNRNVLRTLHIAWNRVNT